MSVGTGGTGSYKLRQGVLAPDDRSLPPLMAGKVSGAFLDAIGSYIGLSAADVVIDIGSGQGNVLAHYSARYGCSCIGIEVIP